MKLKPKYKVGQRVEDLNGQAGRIAEVVWSYAYIFLPDGAKNKNEDDFLQEDELKPLPARKRKAKVARRRG